jgi:lipopolysaccharide assembly protein A
MLRLIRLLLAIVFVAVIVIWSVANRQPVDVSFWPLPFEPQVPLFIVVLASLTLGVLIAWLVAWLSAWGMRRQARRDHRRVMALEAREQMRAEQLERAEIERQRTRREGSMALAPQGR